MAELHSITGLFYENFPGISPWGGHLIRNMEELGENSVQGMLIDVYGPSRITGTMTDEKLKFRKQYERCNREQSFDYTFHLKKGIWLGEYESTMADYNGRSICKTNLCVGDLNFKNFDARTPEGFAKAILESMIASGTLKEFKNPKTGERMIKPGPPKTEEDNTEESPFNEKQ